MQTITTLQFERLLESLVMQTDIPADKRLPIMVAGPPGCGKSGVVEGMTRKLGYDCAVFHPVVSDPTDFKGFPWVNKDTGTADFIPFGDFARLITTKRPTVAFLDDVGHAPKAVQATLMQPLFARTLNGKRISDTVSFVLATNRRCDKAGVEGIIDPIINRCLVYEIAPDRDTFLAYWVKAGHRPEVMAFLRVMPKHLYTPKKSADIENFPSYRTWEFASRILERNLPADLEAVALTGAVGEGTAGEFMAYLKLFRDIPDPDEVIKNPHKAKVPDKADILYALCAALAYRANDATLDGITAYADRMIKAGREEMAVYLMGDVLNKSPQVTDDKGGKRPVWGAHKGVIGLLSGKLGKLLLNE